MEVFVSAESIFVFCFFFPTHTTNKRMLWLPGYFEDKMLENFLKVKKKKKARELPASTNNRRRENT